MIFVCVSGRRDSPGCAIIPFGRRARNWRICVKAIIAPTIKLFSEVFEDNQ